MKLAVLLVALAGTGVAAWHWCPCGGTTAVAQQGAEAGEDAEDAEDGDEVDVALDSVPAKALDAAKGAVPGIAFSSAERETEDGRVVYCLEGTKDGVRYEVEVTPEGTVVEVESGADDD